MKKLLNLLMKYIEEQPNNPIGYINFGNLLMHMNDFERAERFLKKRLSLMQMQQLLIMV